MRNYLPILICFFSFFNVYAQKTIVSPIKNACRVESYIFKDGSFQIRANNTIYSYTSNGELKNESNTSNKWIVNDENSTNNNSITSALNDTKYTINPLARDENSVPAKTMTLYNTILVNNYKTNKQKAINISNENFYFDRLHPSEKAYLTQDDKVVFFANCSVDRDPKFSKNGKHDYQILKVDYDPISEEVKTTPILTNKISQEQLKKSSAYYNIIGKNGSKIYVAVVYQKDFISNKEIDIWTYDLISGAENKEHSFVIAGVNDCWEELLFSTISYETPIISEKTTVKEKEASMFIGLGYTSSMLKEDFTTQNIPIQVGANKLNYSFVEFKPDNTIHSFNFVLFPNQAKIDTKVLMLNSFINESESVLYKQLDGGLLMISKLNETIKYEMIKNLFITDETNGSQFLNELIENDELKQQLTEPFFNSNELSKSNNIYFLSTYRKDEDSWKIVEIGFISEDMIQDDNCPVSIFKIKLITE